MMEDDERTQPLLSKDDVPGEANMEDTNESHTANEEQYAVNYKNKPKFFLGIFLLIIVDVLWVASSELTSYLFKEMKYDKPYMSTYVKISMFSIYLIGFVIYQPWRRQCIRCACDDYPGQYQLLGETDTDTDDGYDYQIKDSLGKSFFVPANLPEIPDDEEEREEAGEQKVKFNDVAEVRHLADNQASYIARLNYGSAVRARLMLRREKGKLTIQQVICISMTFSLVFFMGNIAYQESLSVAKVGVVNVFSSTSCLFTLFLAALFPTSREDSFTFSKLFAVLSSVFGLVLVTLGSTNDDISDYFKSDMVEGILYALLSAFCYAVYLVHFKRSVGSESNIDVPMFFGFVGLFTLALMWPGLILFHYIDIEQFELPNRTQIMYLSINGLLGTVLSELLWMWGCLLTSSLYGTVSLSLTIPLSVIVDIVFRKVSYSWMFFVGTIPCFFSVVAIGILSHYPHYDPVCSFFSCLCNIFRSKTIEPSLDKKYL